MFQALSDKAKALILVLLIVTISVTIAWFTSGWQLTALIATFQLIVVLIARHIWTTDKSNFLLRATVLTIISGVVLLGNSIWQPFIFGLIKQFSPNSSLPDYSVQPITLLFLLGLAWIVFHFTRNSVAIEKPEKKMSDLITEPTIKEKWGNICESLSASIRDIDRSTNWDNNYYTPLDAEVEMRTSNRTNKVVKDLLAAIKESDDRLFLLVGDPGAGKSVALRKLCLDMLKDSVKTEYIPIYVNLKEWTDTKDWTKTKPTSEDLRAFIKLSLLQKDTFLADFFEKYYDILDHNGNLFFILDSFDEMPQVLGTTADAQLIEDLTIVCREFLQGSKQKRSKGILASREYRMPREAYLEANTKLTVRPFTFEKIEYSLTQSGKISKETVEKLLRERPELVPSLRNPFITSLLNAYLTNNKNQFPSNQAELFEDYIRRAILKSQGHKILTDIPFADILNVAIQIAKIIFSESGLQAPLSILRRQIPHARFDDIVTILRHTRIARGDNSAEFSFAHRRFYEYFVVQDLLESGNDLPLTSIPTDSRWRDTLVLYCEVAPFEKAKEIANFCWFKVILPNNDIRNRASKHCLRFLTEAFRGRQERLVDFHDALGEYVLGQIHVDNDPIDIKLAVEALGILSIETLDKGTILALNLKDSWINDTAIRSCRHINIMSNNLKTAIIDIFDSKYEQSSFPMNLTKPKIQMNFNEILTSFSLSDAFSKMKRLVEWVKFISILDWKIFYNLHITLIIGMLFFIIGSTYPNVNDFDYSIKTVLITVSCCCIALFLFFLVLRLMLFCVRFIYFRQTEFIKYQFSSFITSIYNYYERNRKFIFAIIISVIFFNLNFPLEVFVNKTVIKSFVEENIDNEAGEQIMFVLKNSFSIFLIIGFFRIKMYYFIIEFVKDFYNIFFEIPYEFWTNWRIYENIKAENINSRLDVFNDFEKLKESIFLERFLIDLENNVKRVKDTFPEGFLKVGQSPQMTRLIQLEERWREAEEREAEAEQTKRQTAPRESAAKTAKDFVGAGKLAAALEQALAQPPLSTEVRNSLIQFQSRLSKLEGDKQDGVLESTAYEAKYNTLVRDYLNFLDDI